MRFAAGSLMVAAALTALMLLGAQTLAAQDYVQYETQYLNPLPGQSGDLEDALGQHNKRFHNEGAFAARVFAVVNGPRAGQLFWVMGPGTWTHWDARPADDAHDSDWADNVMAHARNGRVEYWRQLDMSTVVATDEVRPLQRHRFFSVENPGAWRRSQAMQEEASAALGISNSRTFYAKQFRNDSAGRQFVLTTSFQGFGDLDAPGRTGGFAAVIDKMIELHGVNGYNEYRADREAAGITYMDEWVQLIPELSGAPDGN